MGNNGIIRINDYDKSFGASIGINTSECVSWGVDGDKPLVCPITSEEDFDRYGVDMNEYPEIKQMKVGDKIALDHDYEGVYLMKVA